MGYLIAFLAAIFALYIVAWLFVAGFLWFLLPAFFFAVPVAAAAGALVATGCAVLTLLGVWSAPRLITAADVGAGTAGLPKLKRDKVFGRDRAWPHYLSRQALVDLGQVWRTNLKWVDVGWTRLGRLLADSWPGRVFGLLIPVPLWVAVSLGALGATAVFLGVGAAVLFVLWVLWMLPTGVLWLGDKLFRRIRDASASCPNCYHVSELPLFVCPHCGTGHRDIRPGRLGGLWRRCGCGALLPTSVVRAALRSTPRCPRCEQTLRAGAGALTDIRLPVFGPVSAGKTRLVHTGLLAIREGVASAGGTVDFVDDQSDRTVEEEMSVIQAGGATVKTPADTLPQAITIKVTLGRRRALVHLFDAAGEFYADREDNKDLEFLDHAQGMVFVVDPFSIPQVRDHLGEGNALVARANPAREAPERVYHVTAQRLRDYGVATAKRRLAIAVVKADLLADLPVAAELTPEDVRTWLDQVGLDNMTLAAERDFGAVRCFLVSSQPGMPPTDSRSPARPLAWLAAGGGFRLWPDPAEETGPASDAKETEEVS